MNCTIKVTNSNNNDLLKVGLVYNIVLKKYNTVGDLLKLFRYMILLENYSEELLINLKEYKLFTKNTIEMDNNKKICDYFTTDHILDIYDRDENIFYAILM